MPFPMWILLSSPFSFAALGLSPRGVAESIDQPMNCRSLEVRQRKSDPLGNGHPQGPVTGQFRLQTFRYLSITKPETFIEFSKAIETAKLQKQFVDDLTIRGALSVLPESSKKDTAGTYLFLKDESRTTDLIPRSVKLILVSALPDFSVSKKQETGLGNTIFSLLTQFVKIRTPENGSTCEASNCLAQQEIKHLGDSPYTSFFDPRQSKPALPSDKNVFDTYVKEISQSNPGKNVPSFLFALEVVPQAHPDSTNPPQNLYGYLWCGSTGKHDLVYLSPRETDPKNPSSETHSTSEPSSYVPTDTPLHCEPFQAGDQIYRVSTSRGSTPAQLVTDLTERGLYEHTISATEKSKTTQILFSIEKNSSNGTQQTWSGTRLAKETRFFTAGILPSLTGVTRAVKTIFKLLGSLNEGRVVIENGLCDVIGCAANAHLQLAESALHDPFYRDTDRIGKVIPRMSGGAIPTLSYRYLFSQEMRKESIETIDPTTGIADLQRRDPNYPNQLKKKGQNPYEPSLGDLAFVIGVEAIFEKPVSAEIISVSPSFIESGQVPANGIRIQGYLRCGTSGAEIPENG